MRHVSAPTWRRLHSCLEYRHSRVPVPSQGHDDRVKTLGLLLGLSRGMDNVLKDEILQFVIGDEAARGKDEPTLAAEVHKLAQSVPIEDFIL